jgi:NarL family two-component system response regulator LiaR
MEKKIRILIVDDHDVVREGLAAIIATQPDLELAGEARDGEEAIRLVRELKPDVTLLDLMMPRKDGLEAIVEIRADNPEARILVLTGFADDERVLPAIRFGALGYLLKDTPRPQLIQAIHDVADGQAHLPPAVALKLMKELNHPNEADTLTDREMATLRLIAQGLGNHEIAERLVLEESTVAKYVSNLLDKLHLANRTQVALYALRKGLAKLEQDD